MVDLDALPRIDSAANDRLKAVRRLVKARDRRREGLFVIEGFRELRRAVDGGLVIRDVFVATSDWTGRQEAGLVDEIVGGGARISVLSSKAFASIATQDAPDGLLGVADIPAVDLSVQPNVQADSLFVVVEGIERPGNLGTIARTAVAADVSGLILCDPQVNAFHPEVVRASVGTLFTLPLSVVGVPELVTWARANGIRLIVTTPATDELYFDADVSGPVAVVVGSEKNGITDAMRAAADVLVRIPMSDAIDSINVGVATGIVLFDVIRARRRAG
ncbi:MAG TPA: RNA methyltransferase [Actinopolymorphaceae bacterium]|jgi:TrmH family RNA methyltransferase